MCLGWGGCIRWAEFCGVIKYRMILVWRLNLCTCKVAKPSQRNWDFYTRTFHNLHHPLTPSWSFKVNAYPEEKPFVTNLTLVLVCSISYVESFLQVPSLLHKMTPSISKIVFSCGKRDHRCCQIRGRTTMCASGSAVGSKRGRRDAEDVLQWHVVAVDFHHSPNQKSPWRNTLYTHISTRAKHAQWAEFPLSKRPVKTYRDRHPVSR